MKNCPKSVNHYQNTDGGNQHLSNNTNSRLKMSQNINKGPYVVRQMQMPSPLFGLQTCIVLFFFFIYFYFFFFLPEASWRSLRLRHVCEQQRLWQDCDFWRLPWAFTCQLFDIKYPFLMPWLKHVFVKHYAWNCSQTCLKQAAMG